MLVKPPSVWTSSYYLDCPAQGPLAGHVELCNSGPSTNGLSLFEHWRRNKDAETPSRPGANKRIGDAALQVHIKAIHAEVKQEYGWPKMWKEQLGRAIRVGKECVKKFMLRHSIKARAKGKFVVGTDSKHNLLVAQNLLDRNFTAETPNQVWTNNITYIATGGGWLYLTGVIDLFGRQLYQSAFKNIKPVSSVE